MACLVLLAVALFSTHVFADTQELEGIAEANARFSREFLKAVNDVQGNLVSSPLSAHLALSMTKLGAGGSTASQMSRALHLPADVTLTKNGLKQLSDQLQSENTEGVNIKIANRIYVQSGFDIEQEFLNSVRDTFNSEPQSVNFVNPGTRNVINQWVEQQTNDKIKDLVKEGALDASTILVLVNAVYFNANWAQKFDPSSTLKSNFYTSDSNLVRVPTMHKTATFNYKMIDDLNAKLIQLPYKGDKMSLVIFLPNARTGLSELENKMQTAELSFLIDSATPRYIRLALPKFKIETGIDLKEPLIKLGLGDIFGDIADFSRISNSHGLKLSQVSQKTIIQVAENGTEAVSATYVTVVRLSASHNPPALYIPIDHPFLFYLVHRTAENNHVVLFSGRVVTPEGY